MASENACDQILATIQILSKTGNPDMKDPAILKLANVYRMLCGKEPV